MNFANGVSNESPVVRGVAKFFTLFAVNDEYTTICYLNSISLRRLKCIFVNLGHFGMFRGYSFTSFFKYFYAIDINQVEQ